jgi:two-component system cell cycle response regulator DivK
MANDSVLVVEDAPVNLKLVRVLLSRQGFDVHTATSAEEALEVFRQFRPRLVLTDVGLPGMNGLELTRHLKSDPATRDTIVLALTAFAMKADEQKAFDAGCDGYITKPIDTRTFPMLIRRYLDQGRERANGATAADSTDAGLDASLCGLREEFAAEGLEECRRLMGTLATGFNLPQAQVTAHRWAGAGGSVGCPEISRSGRELEGLLQQNRPGSLAHVRDLLVRLERLFTEATAKPTSPKKPEAAVATLEPQGVPSPALLAALSGKRFALAGFPREEAERLAQGLDRMQAFTRDLGADAVPDAETVRPFDVIVFHVANGVQAIPQWNKPVLLIGKREGLLALQPRHGGAEDFLFSPWNPEEVVLRSYFLITHDSEGRPSPPGPSDNGKRRVLVADDDSTIRALVEATVANSGFECRVASDGAAALEIVRSWRPDLAVLDVNMPNKNGFEVLSSLRNEPLTRDIRIILLTARQQETDVIRGFALGADDYVIKPFSPMELVARLKRLVGKHA